MTLEDTLEDLAERRLAYRAFRESVEEELRLLRIEKLSAEQSSIEHIVVKAAAEGATTGQIKRAYGTKDHRTITDILSRRAAEIDALINQQVQEAKDTSWFTITEEGIAVTINTSSALFTYTYVDGEIMLTTTTPLWNEDFTARNEAVALLDGETEGTSEEVRRIVEALDPN